MFENNSLLYLAVLIFVLISLKYIFNLYILYGEPQLLDELLDNGFPLATECNILKELIKPPNILRTIADTVTGKSST